VDFRLSERGLGALGWAVGARNGLEDLQRGNPVGATVAQAIGWVRVVAPIPALVITDDH
jgi:hypothetical protein